MSKIFGGGGDPGTPLKYGPALTHYVADGGFAFCRLPIRVQLRPSTWLIIYELFRTTQAWFVEYLTFTTDLYTKAVARFSWNGVNTFCAKNDVRQGGILSARCYLLLSIYIDGLLGMLRQVYDGRISIEGWRYTDSTMRNATYTANTCVENGKKLFTVLMLLIQLDNDDDTMMMMMIIIDFLWSRKV